MSGDLVPHWVYFLAGIAVGAFPRLVWKSLDRVSLPRPGVHEKGERSRSSDSTSERD